MAEVGTVQLQALSKDLAAASGEPFRQVAAGLVQSAAHQIEQYAKAYAPVRTGRLRASIHTIPSNNGMSATVTTGTNYAVFDEFGTGTRGEFPGRPITIRPRRSQYLRFRAKNGQIIYAKKVVNPGMAPRPFMRPAIERVALPLATAMGDNAVIFIVRGPKNPETLANAPATGWH